MCTWMEQCELVGRWLEVWAIMAPPWQGLSGSRGRCQQWRQVPAEALLHRRKEPEATPRG